MFTQVWNKFTKITKTICGFNDNLKLRGMFNIEHYRDGVKIETYQFHNDIVTQGKNSVLDIMFRAQTQITSWYFGLVNNSGFSAFDSTDVMSSHSGWTEFTSYDEATRVAWSPAAASSGSISNSSTSDFSINASGTLKAIFVTSGSAKSGTTGTLWSTCAFAGTVSIVNGDLLKITYTVNA